MRLSHCLLEAPAIAKTNNHYKWSINTAMLTD